MWPYGFYLQNLLENSHWMPAEKRRQLMAILDAAEHTGDRDKIIDAAAAFWGGVLDVARDWGYERADELSDDEQQHIDHRLQAIHADLQRWQAEALRRCDMPLVSTQAAYD